MINQVAQSPTRATPATSIDKILETQTIIVMPPNETEKTSALRRRYLQGAQRKVIERVFNKLKQFGQPFRRGIGDPTVTHIGQGTPQYLSGWILSEARK